MALDFCPGSSRFRQPEPENVTCPGCGEEIEIWTDEIKAVCPKCKKSFLREQKQSCLDWCRYAKECVGDDTYKQYMSNKFITIKQKLLKVLEEYFADDQKRIDHAKKVMHFAEELLKAEGGDWHIVIPASILHDVGIKVSEEKYGSSAGSYQQKEGPAIAKKMLLKLSFKKEDIEEICEIIAYHHTPGEVTTPNFKILYDADRMVNLKDETNSKDKVQLKQTIEKTFLTENGRKLAEKEYLIN